MTIKRGGPSEEEAKKALGDYKPKARVRPGAKSKSKTRPARNIKRGIQSSRASVARLKARSRRRRTSRTRRR